MKLHPHLHLLVPSSDPSVSLEVRLYLPQTVKDGPTPPVPLEVRSTPSPNIIDDGKGLGEWLNGLGVRRLISACHPLGRIGGNCLDPVISESLIRAVYGDSEDSQSENHGDDTAVLSWNVRGVGRSEGSMRFLGLSTMNDEKDLTALESWALEAFGTIKELRRFGYSAGSVATVNAPYPSTRPSSILLVSPAVTLFKAMTLLSSRTFSTGLREFLKPTGPLATHIQSDRKGSDANEEEMAGVPVPVWLIYGTKDEFTGTSAYKNLEEEYKDSSLIVRQMEGGTHFYRTQEEADWLTGVFGEWLRS